MKRKIYQQLLDWKQNRRGEVGFKLYDYIAKEGKRLRIYTL